jgi:hypothetical protein
MVIGLALSHHRVTTEDKRNMGCAHNPHEYWCSLMLSGDCNRLAQGILSLVKRFIFEGELR